MNIRCSIDQWNESDGSSLTIACTTETYWHLLNVINRLVQRGCESHFAGGDFVLAAKPEQGGQASEIAKRRRAALLVDELLKLLNTVEVSDSGREFHPTTINSCRTEHVMRLQEILPELADLLASAGQEGC